MFLGQVLQLHPTLLDLAAMLAQEHWIWLKPKPDPIVIFVILIIIYNLSYPNSFIFFNLFKKNYGFFFDSNNIFFQIY
jgi:hypothetical protein